MEKCLLSPQQVDWWFFTLYICSHIVYSFVQWIFIKSLLFTLLFTTVIYEVKEKKYCGCAFLFGVNNSSFLPPCFIHWHFRFSSIKILTALWNSLLPSSCAIRWFFENFHVEIMLSVLKRGNALVRWMFPIHLSKDLSEETFCHVVKFVI